MNITIAEARMICQMDEACWSEGFIPEGGAAFMKRIGKYFPELKEEFAFLPWSEYDTAQDIY